MYTLILSKRTFQFRMLHDFVDVVSGSNRRRHRMRIQNSDIIVSSTGEMESRRAAPGSSPDYENWWRCIECRCHFGLELEVDKSRHTRCEPIWGASLYQVIMMDQNAVIPPYSYHQSTWIWIIIDRSGWTFLCFFAGISPHFIESKLPFGEQPWDAPLRNPRIFEVTNVGSSEV